VLADKTSAMQNSRASSSAGAEEDPLIDAVDFDLAPAPTGCIRGPVQNLFLHQTNPRFAINVELAFRGAFFLLIAGIPVIVPSGKWEVVDYMIHTGIYNSSVCCFIIFNLGRTFGEALNKVNSGFRGTFAAAAIGWSLYTIWPDGYTEESGDLDFWLIVAIGTIYVCLVMLLKLDVSFQMFAISNFAGIWMDILNPAHRATITPPWAGNWSVETDDLLTQLIRTFIGLLTVTVALLLPYPLWSLVKVQENQLVLNTRLTQILGLMVNLYSQDMPKDYEKAEVLKLFQGMKFSSGENDPLIAEAWWECFGFGRTQLKRQVLFSMSQTTRKIYLLAYNAWTVSSDQIKSGKDAELMRLVKDKTESVLKEMGRMLDLLVKAAEDGKFDPNEAKAVKTCKGNLERLERELAAHFHAKRLEVAQKAPKLPGGTAESMYKEVRFAQVLTWSISRIVGEVIQLADGVCKFSNGEASLPPPPDSAGFLAVFQGVAEKEHLLYAWRGISSYLLSFMLGYFGFKQIVPPYSSGIAATAPLLLSMYVGSALVNDLNRIQGLMIGNVIARILRGLIDDCDPADLVIHAVITFAWVWTGLFVCFHSRSYSTIGVLAAAFGALTLLADSCNHLSDNVGKRATFDSLAMNCIAVMITMCADFMFQADRASDQAHKILDQCWSKIHDSLAGLLNPNVKTVAFESAKAKELLTEAIHMGEEANLEPRFWRTIWHQELFTGVCRATDALIVATAALESAIAEHGNDADAKFATFVDLSTPNSSSATTGIFGSPGEVDVLRNFKAVQKLLHIFVHETVRKFEGTLHEHRDTGNENKVLTESEVETQFIKRTVPKFFGIQDQPKDKMSHDQMANLSVVFAGRVRIKDLLRKVQKIILASHWEQ